MKTLAEAGGHSLRGASPAAQIAPAYLLALAFAFCLCAFFPFPLHTDTAIFLYRQDVWLLLAGSAVLMAACIALPHRARDLRLPRAAVAATAIALVAICYLGHRWVLGGFDLSRDEQLAVFDSLIFRSGHLVQPLPPSWQGYAKALNTLYMLPVAHPIAWISAYLPINALLRATIGLLADPALTGPVMVAVGLIALWKCARIIWPEDCEAAVIALILYVCSGQILFAGMTAYAMPAHLAFNLLWLWLFLLDRRSADVVALLIGFAATGLHQPLFHPLFAGPILLTMLRNRNWPRIAFYAAGYAAICAFWMMWPHWMLSLVMGPHSVPAATGGGYAARLLHVLSKGDPMRWQEMAANLLRFLAWQDLLLLPLMLAAIPAIRGSRLAAAFAASTLLPTLVMLVILPNQGHGYGYRYVHGALGSAILLAVYGWRRLVPDRGWLRPLLLRSSLGSVFVLLPLQGAMAHEFSELFARVDRKISASKADYAIVGELEAPYALDLADNRPDLTNRPIRLVAGNVNEELIRSICRKGVHVAIPAAALFRPIEAYFLMAHSTASDARLSELSRLLAAAGCRVERLDGP